MNDPYMLQNLSAADRNAAIREARSLRPDGIPLSDTQVQKLFSEEYFNSAPLPRRKAFFESIGAQPIKVSQNAPASSGSPVLSGLEEALKETRREYETKASAPQTPPAAQAPAEAEPPSDLQNALSAIRKEYETAQTQKAETETKQATERQAADVASIPTPTQDLSAPRKVGKVKDSVGPMAQFGRAAASLYDATLGGIVPGIVEPVTYAGARAFGKSPEAAKELSTAAAAPFEAPAGKALGITETPEYQGEATRRLFNFIGENFQKGAAWVAEKTGLPVQDVENMMGTLAAGAGVKAAPMVQRGTVRGAEAVETAIGTAPTAPPVAAALPRVEPQIAPTTKPKVSYADFQAQLEARKAGGVAADLQETMTAKQGLLPMSETGANPFAGKFTGEEGIRGQFPQIKLSKMANNVPMAEADLRAAVASEILGDSDSIRKGVVTGNEQTLRNEYMIAKKAGDTPEGMLMREQLAREQNALSNYAAQRLENSGANLQLLSPAERGQTINSFFAGQVEPGQPATSLTSFFQQEKGRLYDEARQRVGDNPIVTSNVNDLLSDPQFRAGLKLTGNEKVAEGVDNLIQLARDVGFKDSSGNFFPPNSIGAWDAVRKALNADWTKDNAKTIAKINNAIDRDIASAGGGDLLKRADSVHQMEKTILGSKGIKTIFGEVDSNGVETGRAFDNIPKDLNQLSFAQWKHIYDTADKLSQGKLVGPIDPKTKLPKWELTVPDEVRAAATQAKNEMRGNIAREVYEAGGAKAGAWNANAANNVLNARADKIRYSFPIDEQKKFHTLNYGGYMMPEQHPYEGAALQERRVGLLEKTSPAIGTSVGMAVGSAIDPGVGSMVGAAMGTSAGAKFQAKQAAKAEKKQAEKRKKELEAFGQYGKDVKLKDIGKE
jgi:hypothetical protein